MKISAPQNIAPVPDKNLKDTNKPEFIKEAYSKDLNTHDSSNVLYPNKYRFYFFNWFYLNNF